MQEGLPEKEPFPIPFIDNIHGETALHLSLTKETLNLTKASTENSRVAEFFLQKLLPNMPLDHHGRAIADILPECVTRNIRFLAEYMDSRFLSTAQLQKVSRADKKAIKVDPETEDQGYYVAACDLWPDERYIEAQIFESSKSSSEIKVTVLDLPKLHIPTKLQNPQNPSESISFKMMQALADVDDRSIFSCRAVQSIIAFRWGPCKAFVLRRQMLPYTIYFLSYLIYVFFIMEKRIDYKNESIEGGDEYDGENVEVPAGYRLFETVWNIELILFSMFFLGAERRQLSKKGWDYFKDVWNYADVLPPVIIITVCCVDFFAKNEAPDGNVAKFRYSMQAIASFGMWIKIFYFLRIFR